jgi:hypothetical protein
MLAHLASACDRDDAVRDPKLKLPPVIVRQGTLECQRSPVPLPTTYLRVPAPSDLTTSVAAGREPRCGY